MADQTVPRRIFYVYVLFRHDTGLPFYIGKGRGSRWTVHETLSRHDKNRHKSAIIRQAKAAGSEIAKVKIASNLSESEAFEMERVFIKALGRSENGGLLVNLTDGGEGQSGYRHTEETKRKFSLSLKGRVRLLPMRLEHRASISAAKKGKRLSDAHAKAMQGKHLGHTHTAETKAKIGAKHKGKIVSVETRSKIGKAGTGRVTSPETKIKISAASSKRVYPDDYSAAFVARAVSRISTPATAETRRMISLSRIGIKLTPEHKALISEHLRNRGPVSAETSEKLSSWQRGKKRSEEDKLKMRQGWARRKLALLLQEETNSQPIFKELITCFSEP